MKSQWQDHLAKLGACDEALAFAERYTTFAAAYKECTEPHWLLWLLPQIGCDLRKYVGVVCEIADPEAASVRLQPARRWANGAAVTKEELRAGARAASWIVAGVTTEAAWAAYWAASARRRLAAESAAEVAWIVAEAAEARDAEIQRQVELIRRTFSRPSLGCNTYKNTKME